MRSIVLICLCLLVASLGTRLQGEARASRNFNAESSAIAEGSVHPHEHMQAVARLLLATESTSAFLPSQGPNLPKSLSLAGATAPTRAWLPAIKHTTKFAALPFDDQLDDVWQLNGFRGGAPDEIETDGPKPVIISASVAKADLLNLGANIQTAVQSGADWLHFSVTDGEFMPGMGVGSATVAAARAAFPSVVIDVQLGRSNPERSLNEFIRAGADVISFRPDATRDPAALVRTIAYSGCAPGLVLNPRTSVGSIKGLLEDVDVIVIRLTSTRVDSSWDPSARASVDAAIQKIGEIRSLCMKRGLPMPHIQVDGGVFPDHAAELINAGATVVVAGSWIFSPDRSKFAIDALRSKR